MKRAVDDVANVANTCAFLKKVYDTIKDEPQPIKPYFAGLAKQMKVPYYASIGKVMVDKGIIERGEHYAYSWISRIEPNIRMSKALLDACSHDVRMVHDRHFSSHNPKPEATDVCDIPESPSISQVKSTVSKVVSALISLGFSESEANIIIKDKIFK